MGTVPIYRRRQLLAAAALAFAAPSWCLGQQRGKVWRIGFISPRAQPQPGEPYPYYAIVQGMNQRFEEAGRPPSKALTSRLASLRRKLAAANKEARKRRDRQAVLEARACGRSVVATRVGGPPEFVPPEAGVLVDPLDVDEMARGLETAAGLPCPNPVARAAAERHDLAEQARRVERGLERAARVG